MQNESQIQQELNIPSNNDTVSIFSKELLRDILLPDLLGKDHSQILYWAGKQLARKFPLNNEEMYDFFNKAGWGELTKAKSSKKEAEYILSGPIISRRFDLNTECEFHLEAGFLAEQIQLQNKRITEAVAEPKRKAGKVKFLVRWDSKDITD